MNTTVETNADGHSLQRERRSGRVYVDTFIAGKEYASGFVLEANARHIFDCEFTPWEPPRPAVCGRAFMYVCPDGRLHRAERHDEPCWCR